MFEGFTPQTIDFLWNIRFNNNREWFEQHKEEYLTTLYHPMKALGEEIYQRFSHIDGLKLRVSRIYRDARYAKGVPYKDSLWFCIREDVDSWSEHPCLFFDINPEQFGYGFGMVMPKAHTMVKLRDHMQEHPQEFVKVMKQAERVTGFPITGDEYKRKKPCPSPKVEAYYNLKNILCLTYLPVGEALFTKDVEQEVGETLEKLLPLFNYLRKHGY